MRAFVLRLRIPFPKSGLGSSVLFDRYRAVIVDMVAMHIVEMTVVNKVKVVAMSDHSVRIFFTVHMVCVCFRRHGRFGGRIGFTDF